MNEIFSNIKFTNDAWIFLVPTILMGLDILSGMINAWAKKEFKSSKIRLGLAKKCGEILILIIGEVLTAGLMLPKYVITAISVYIIFMELTSLIENLDKLGVPIPKSIKDRINNELNKG